MITDFPEIERLTSEELLSIVLSIVAPAECDPLHECGLRFDAQRAATELYCRAASVERADATTPAGATRIGAVTTMRPA